MLSIEFIRENAEIVKQNNANKCMSVDIDKLLALDEKVRSFKSEIDKIREQRNTLSNKNKGSRPSEEDIQFGKDLKEKLAQKESELKNTEDEFITLLKQVPNIAEKDVPVGHSEEENVVIKQVGKKPEFDFEPKNHAQIAEAKGWLDKERASKVAGARFGYIKGDMARLSWAMMQFAADRLSDENVLKEIAQKNNLKVSTKPFELVLPPLMIKTEVYDAMDRLEPRDDRYKIDGEELWLQGSAEHVLGSMHMNEILDEKQLPIRYLGYATSFRKEAGTYGKDMEGIIRMHQFDKLEMESLSSKEDGRNEHLFMAAIQEYLMQELKLPYQVLQKCTYDIGKPDARAVDVEVWLPGQNKYRETHTADYMTDYQARRLNTRVRKNSGELELIHTNDATALSQRPLIAIIENYQTAEGDVIVPDVLVPYMLGKTRL